MARRDGGRWRLKAAVARHAVFAMLALPGPSGGASQHAIGREVVYDTDCSAGMEEAEAGNLSRRRIADA